MFINLFGKTAIIFSFIALPYLTLSTSAMACDDKACEAAYLSATQRYIDNEIRHAVMFRAERLAYAKNRERRALALYMHIHQTKFGRFRYHEEMTEKPAKNKNIATKTSEKDSHS